MSKYYVFNEQKWFAGATPVNAVAATSTLTVDTQVDIADTVTIGTKLFTFVADGAEAVDGDISIGTDLATGQANIVAAINGTDSINIAIDRVSIGAFAANDAIVSYTVGTEGNSIATTSSFTTGTNLFSSATLIGGQYATQVATSAIWFNGSDVYVASFGVSRTSTDGWESGTLS